MITEFKMPKLGESITEATIINWMVGVGQRIEAEETLLEVATDKVDSEVPSAVSGIVTEIRYQKGDVVKVGEVLALIETTDEKIGGKKITIGKTEEKSQTVKVSSEQISPSESNLQNRQQLTVNREPSVNRQPSDQFLSPLIISIAQKENLSIEELQTIPGSGADGRIQKSDVFNYLKSRKYPVQSIPSTVNRQPTRGAAELSGATTSFPKPPINYTQGKDRIIEMDRMRSMIAEHMVYSKHTSPHVTSYLEVDVTDLVNWRNSQKDEFEKKHGQKLTFTPIFVNAVAKAIADFPMINVSVDGKKIYVHKDIHVGMATALPTGNLIVPVVRNASEKSLVELAADVNKLADAARNNKLKPDQVGGSTFTISNVGTFGSLMGTPIINQPEAAILAFGIIKKRPEVITSENGDEIAIRSMMFLSLSFDHRIIDGFLGGSFLKRVGDNLENFTTQSDCKI